MTGEVVWSINIMMAILMAGVSATIVWIFKYDDWNPNPVVHSDISDESQRMDSGDEELGSGAE